MWLTSGVSTSIPWPKEEQTVFFEGVEIEILPESKDDMPMVRLDLGKHKKNMDQGREFLNRFFSSLSWSKRGYIKEELSLGSGAKGGRIGKSSGFSVMTSRFDDDYMPTGLNEKQNLALALYREAQSLNNPTYKYLGYFKILNIENEKSKDHRDWINQNLKNLKRTDSISILKKLQGTHDDIGSYLYKSGRCAVAHAFDQDNLINPDKYEDIKRLTSELDLIQELAELFIESELGVKSKSTYYKEHLYELEGVKALFTPEQIEKIIVGDDSVLQEISLPNFCLAEQHNEQMGTFAKMKVANISVNNGGLLIELHDVKSTLALLVHFHFKEERLGWDLMDNVGLLSDKPSKDLYQSLIDLMNFRIQMFRNGRFSIYNEDRTTLLGRTDPFILCNIDLSRTIENFEQSILKYQQEIDSL